MVKLFFLSCLVTAASAQAAGIPALETVSPRLAPVELAKDGSAIIKKIRPVAPAAVRRAPSETLQRLDSVVGFNSDDTKGTLQVFGYDDNDWWVESRNYQWNSDTESWGEPVETFYCTRMDNGDIISEVNMSMLYNSGMRNDYEYDELGRGVKMTSYYYDGSEWIPSGLGEYDYDDNDNIIEEYTSYWDNEKEAWVHLAHNIATWDDKKRQTSIEQYSWDGSAWQPITKVDYEWYNGPIDPDYIPGTEKERMTYRGEYFIIDGDWLLTCITENFFHEDGRIAGQSYKYYNREYDNWYGGDDLDGRLFLCNSWISEIGYDERGLQNVNRTLQWVPGTEEKLFELGYVDYQEIEKENGDFVIVATNQNNIFDEEGNKTGTQVIDKVWYGYNANCQKLSVYQEMPYGDDGPLIPILEDKWGYDEYGYLSETMSFDYDLDGNRIPAHWTIERHDQGGNTIEVIGHENADAGGLQPLMSGRNAPDEERDYCITDNDRNDNWIITNRWTYVYENGVQTERRGYNWDGDVYINFQGQNNYFDFSVVLEDMLVPQAYTDIYKIDRIEYLHGSGEDWISTNAYYYYSGKKTSVGSIDTDKLIAFNGNTVRILDGSESNIVVSDMTGKTVFSTFGAEADLSNLLKGIYIVTVNDASGCSNTMKVFVK